MAWTAPPRTWTAGETLTAANLNAHLRDQLNWLANDRPRVRASRVGTQSISNATDTAVAFTSADVFDVGAMHDPVTNNTRLTVPSGGDGLYLIGGSGLWAAASDNTRSLYVRSNGTDFRDRNRDVVENAAGAVAHYMQVHSLIALVAGDYLELVANQDSGGALNISEVSFWAIWQAF